MIQNAQSSSLSLSPGALCVQLCSLTSEMLAECVEMMDAEFLSVI